MIGKPRIQEQTEQLQLELEIYKTVSGDRYPEIRKRIDSLHQVLEVLQSKPDSPGS